MNFTWESKSKYFKPVSKKLECVDSAEESLRIDGALIDIDYLLLPNIF